MLTAVQAAAVAAAAAFVVGICVAIYVMLKAVRLMSDASAAVAGLRERGDVLIERASAAIDQAGEQIARTETVTASLEGVTAAMGELDGHLTALAPAPPAIAPARPAQSVQAATGRALTWAAALMYGVRWALGLRLPAGQGAPRQPREAGRRAALAGRANGARR